jgi:protein translocase SecG subunit
MSFIIGLLLFVLFLNAIFLILLILVQLPKKETGVGMAFGGGAGEALFQGGAASALSKMTTKATIAFLCFTVVVSVLVSANSSSRSSGKISKLLEEESTTSLPSTDNIPVQVGSSNQTVVTPQPEVEIPVPQNSSNQPVEIDIPESPEVEAGSQSGQQPIQPGQSPE